MSEINDFIIGYKQKGDCYEVYLDNNETLKVPATKENEIKILNKIEEQLENLENMESGTKSNIGELLPCLAPASAGLFGGISSYQYSIPDFPLPLISAFLSPNFSIMLGVSSGLIMTAVIFLIILKYLLLKEVKRKKCFLEIVTLIKKLPPEIISETTKQQIIAFEKVNVEQSGKMKLKELKTTLNLLKRDKDLGLNYTPYIFQELCLKK